MFSSRWPFQEMLFGSGRFSWRSKSRSRSGFSTCFINLYLDLHYPGTEKAVHYGRCLQLSIGRWSLSGKGSFNWAGPRPSSIAMRLPGLSLHSHLIRTPFTTRQCWCCRSKIRRQMSMRKLRLGPAVASAQETHVNHGASRRFLAKFFDSFLTERLI